MNAPVGVDALLRRNGVQYATARRQARTRGHGLGVRAARDDQIARSLLLVDRHHYALAVIPKNRLIDLSAIEEEFGRRFQMASQDEVARLFPGLPLRALPPIANGNQIETFLEQSLVKLSDVYFEVADPLRLVRLDGESFRSLFYGAWCGHISRTAP